MPRSPPRFDVVHVNGQKLCLARKAHGEGGLHQVQARAPRPRAPTSSSNTAYTTCNGIQTYIGTYESEFDAAVAIAFAKKFEVDYLPSPKAKDGQGKEELSPFHGIDDKEASRLASPRASYPASPIPQPQDLSQATLRGRTHKSLL